MVLKLNENNEITDFEVVNVEVVDYDDHEKLFRGDGESYDESDDDRSDDGKWCSSDDNTSLMWQYCCDRYFWSF